MHERMNKNLTTGVYMTVCSLVGCLLPLFDCSQAAMRTFEGFICSSPSAEADAVGIDLLSRWVRKRNLFIVYVIKATTPVEKTKPR